MSRWGIDVSHSESPLVAKSQLWLGSMISATYFILRIPEDVPDEVFGGDRMRALLGVADELLAQMKGLLDVGRGGHGWSQAKSGSYFASTQL